MGVEDYRTTRRPRAFWNPAYLMHEFLCAQAPYERHSHRFRLLPGRHILPRSRVLRFSVDPVKRPQVVSGFALRPD